MSAWMNEWLNEWVNERASEWVSEWVSKWVTEWASERVDERVCYLCNQIEQTTLPHVSSRFLYIPHKSSMRGSMLSATPLSKPSVCKRIPLCVHRLFKRCQKSYLHWMCETVCFVCSMRGCFSRRQWTGSVPSSGTIVINLIPHHKHCRCVCAALDIQVFRNEALIALRTHHTAYERWHQSRLVWELNGQIRVWFVHIAIFEDAIAVLQPTRCCDPIMDRRSIARCGKYLETVSR